MRIGVLRTQVPFVTGGAERHAAGLVAALKRHGHDATEIALPFKWYPGTTLTDSILAAKLTDLSESEGVPIDRMIGLKFPAYLARHPDMRFWILHQHRQAYDMWDLGTSDLLDDPDGLALCELIRAEDRAAFAASPHPIHANSQNVAARLKRYLGQEAIPLYHPPPHAERFEQGAYGDYLFAPGRINPSKRLELMLQALAVTGAGIRLVVAGTAGNPAYQDRLDRLARELGIAGRVEWLGRIDDATLRRFYAEARAVVFVPRDEDYGYITLEAMLAARPVITVEDAGGPLEFVTHEAEGLIVPARPEPLGRAFERMMQDPGLAERLGRAGLAKYRKLGISWENVVETLTGQPAADPGPVAAARVPAPDPARATMTAAEQLKAAVAPPPPPPGLPFARIEDVLRAYAFEELPAKIGQDGQAFDAGLAAYLGTHWTRFLTTLDLIGDLNPATALDVGVFPPLVFQALLANRFPGIAMAGLWEGPYPYRQRVRSHEGKLPGFDITLRPANSERDRWPYEDESFDLVTGMEILEHLALDPYFFYAEAARVLRPGGHLVLSTPNVASHRGVGKVLAGIAPYSFGIFVPTGGVYGRHNREYAPPELAVLGKAAGFETVRLTTADVYDRDLDPAIAELLVARGDDLSLRGETILYLARKTGAPGGVPEQLYHGDPVRMSGAMRLAGWEDDTGLLRLAVENRSPAWWQTEGARATCLLAEWINAGGEMEHQLLIQPLTAPVAPGTSQTVRLKLDPKATRQGRGELRLHLFQSGVGVFSGTGRADPILLPCSEEAFFHLARTAPKPGA